MLMDKDTFTVTWELVPGRGAFEKAQESVLVLAEMAAKGGKVHAVSITDNPGGSAALSAEMLGAEIMRLGIEPLVHFTCKDKNRNQMESLLFGLERASVRNLLIMTGDHPKAGSQGQARGVFDLDPVTLLELIERMNAGLEVPGPKGITRLQPTHFLAGAVASPFKAVEGEQMGQYYKLKKKLKAGAGFVVSQIGFDARKFQELLLFVKSLGFGNVPVVGNIFLLNSGAAKVMNANDLPGCVVSNELLARVLAESEASDKGKAARLERAAEMFAVLKGMGYAGTHIGGHNMSYQDLEYILGRGDELLPVWQDLLDRYNLPQKNGWYYFEQDSVTGLNKECPVDRSATRPRRNLVYRSMRMLHGTAFNKTGLLFRPMKALAKVIDGSRLEGTFRRLEDITKEVTNECRHCGDCAMAELAFLCPMSQCPKNQRNGPCGGSYEGWCERFPGQKQCVWVRAYSRLKSEGSEETLGATCVPPVDYALAGTSSWLNFYLGRDHLAKLPPAE
jgi:methylenetetrahydrofolate reductase (NADPH)